MLEQIEAGQYIQDLKLSVLQAIQYIIQSWNEVTTETISNCWNHTKILPNTERLDNIDTEDADIEDADIENANIEDADTENADIEVDDFVLNEISRMLEVLNLPNSMNAKEFLNISEENIVYEVPEDIIEFIEMLKKRSDENNDEMDDSIETEIINANVALKSLKNMHTFLLQQEKKSGCIKLVNKIEKFIRKKQTQTTIIEYF